MNSCGMVYIYKPTVATDTDVYRWEKVPAGDMYRYLLSDEGGPHGCRAKWMGGGRRTFTRRQKRAMLHLMVRPYGINMYSS